MYIAMIIGSILSFLCALVPLFGLPITMIFSIMAIVFSIIILKKNEEDKKAACIIALILVILAICISMIVNFFAIKTVLKEFNDQIDYNAYYEKKFSNYKTYNLGDDMIIIGDVILNVNDISNDGNKCFTNITIKSVKDNTYFDIYNLGIYDANEDEFYFVKPNMSINKFISGYINENEVINVDLEFDTKANENNEKYLVYTNNEIGIKIKI